MALSCGESPAHCQLQGPLLQKHLNLPLVMILESSFVIIQRFFLKKTSAYFKEDYKNIIIEFFEYFLNFYLLGILKT